MITIKGKNANAKIYTDNIESTAMDQVKNMVNHEITEKTQVRIMPDCLTDDTEVLTIKGFKLIKELNTDDIIAEYNASTKSITWSVPNNIIVRKLRNNEKVFRFKNNQHNIQIDTTENHRNAIVNKMGIKTKDIKDYIRIKEIVWNGNTKSQGLKISDDMLKFISWVIADGNIKITKNPQSLNYRIRVGAKKERKIKEITSLINNLKLEHVVRVCPKRGTEFTLNTASSKQVLELLDYKKEFPMQWITLLSANQIKILIEEYIKSDGDYENYLAKGSIGIGSSNKNIVDFFSAITSLGYGSSYVRERISSKRSFKPGKVYYYISIVPNYRLENSLSGYPNKKMMKEEIEYTNQVVCIETNTGYFIARQKGRTFITGNCHAGAGSTIGTTIRLPENFEDWKVCPNVVGVDINCGVMMYKISNKDVDLSKLDEVINNKIPAGYNTHNKAKDIRFTQDVLDNLSFDIKKEKLVTRIHNSLGTLGGGNHFIELGQDEENNYWLSVHSGSRNLGVQVAEHHQNIAIELLNKPKININDVIDKLKSEGRHSEIEGVIKDINKNNQKPSREAIDLAYLQGDLLKNYLSDMEVAQEYARQSREKMLDIICKAMGFEVIDKFDSAHNFIEHDNFTNGMIRKGATSAKKGERLVIPLNMHDGSIIAMGKGNEDWNCSAPHGAGRLMSRSKAKEIIKLEDFKNQMKDVYSSSIVESTIDEAPGAYKPAEEILSYIQPTVDVIHLVRPVYNFKAH